MRLPGLLDALASYGVHDRASLTVFARRLREAGLLPESKRGRGAEHVQASGTTNLMLAAMGTGSPSKGPEIATRLRSLPWNFIAIRSRSGDQSKVEEQGSLHLPAALTLLKPVFDAATFGEALDFLFSRAAALNLELPETASIDVEIGGPNYGGVVEVNVIDDTAGRLNVLDLPYERYFALWGSRRNWDHEEGWSFKSSLHGDVITSLSDMINDGEGA